MSQTRDVFKHNSEPTIRYDIFIAGSIEVAKQSCREYCMAIGLCVTIEAVTYIYTGGEEDGVRVGLINYPRFPKDKKSLLQTTEGLAEKLRRDLYQFSYTIVGPEETTWYTHNPVQLEPIK